ncbi:MAG TPA: DegT/DnrJ/EryC1/StrS family aminotransferase [Ignavibacteria bacterium]|nr:DegT/DnrJ/EryC1/StrS family aminotransferase [Ignavibacteria bacterium]HMR38828.1 DegT/DnrJ/EryC1/StrS family aminotransferase [Ignavibacteria bacterium]
MIPIAKPYLTSDEAKSAYDTILTGWVTQGPRVEEFEKKFCEYTGAKYAAAVSNCTTALHLAMIVSEIGEGDEVITPSMSYVASANCIRYAGATPVFGEIDRDTYNLNAEHAESLITEKTKAIILVHQLGMPADIDAFVKLSEKYNIKIIEDAACAAGSSYKGKKIGSNPGIICFSFHPRKVITTGEGGMITTDDESIYQKVKLLRQHGMSVNDRARHESGKIIFEDHIVLGYNYRMTDIQASIGLRQLEKLDHIIEERRKTALKYIKELSSIECLELPIEKEGYFSNYQSFSIYLKDSAPVGRNELMEKLLNAGISSRRGVLTAHRETSYRDEYKDLRLPVSEDACDRSIMIPLYAPMDPEDITHIINTLKQILN